MAEFVESEVSPFKILEKKVKECKHLSEIGQTVIDLSKESSIARKTAEISLFGETKELFTFEGYDGLLVVKNALPIWTQIEMAYLALAECPEPPNNTSLGGNEGAGVWNQNKNILSSIEANNTQSLCETTLQLRSTNLGHMRWSALGFQYDWTAKIYPQTIGHENNDTPPILEQIFPRNLSCLVKEIVRAISLQSQTHPELNMTIEPEAAIVNYCMPGSFMGGHVDDSELTHDHPVVSISLGRPCAFLVGGLTKNEPPIAILLRSGDTVLLSGHSRLCYHGVTRIYDCPYSSNYRKEQNKKRVRCSKDCLNICCERVAVDNDTNNDTTHDNNQKSTNLSFDEFLFSNEEFSEVVHTSLSGVHCHQSTQELPSTSTSSSSSSDQSKSCCSKCSHEILSKEEERQVLNYLKLSRININVRQVYPSNNRQPATDDQQHATEQQK